MKKKGDDNLPEVELEGKHGMGASPVLLLCPEPRERKGIPLRYCTTLFF
jgi:hypothetical protein